MTKIIYLKSSGVFGGQYQFEDDLIVMNVLLKEFPVLHDAVLAHEKAHQHDKTVLAALKREAKDYPKLYSMPEYWQYKRRFRQEHTIKKHIIGMAKMAFYHCVALPIHCSASIEGYIRNLTRSRNRRKPLKSSF